MLRPSEQQTHGAGTNGQLMIRVRSRALALVTLALLLISEGIVGWARQCGAREYFAPAVGQRSILASSTSPGRPGRALFVAHEHLSPWRIVATSAKIRASQDLSSEVVASLKRGDLVVALGEPRAQQRLHLVWPVQGWSTVRTSRSLLLVQASEATAEHTTSSVTVWSDPAGQKKAGELANGSLCITGLSRARSPGIQVWPINVTRLLAPIEGWITASALAPDVSAVAPSPRNASGVATPPSLGPTRSCSFRQTTSYYAPPELLLAQQVWNAAQVGVLLVFFCLVATYMNHCWIVWLWCASTMLLPFAAYVTAPGARLFTALALVGAGTLAFTAPDIWVCITPPEPAQPKGAPQAVWFHVTSFEFLGFSCNLLSSLYNFHASPKTWPHWMALFKQFRDYVGLVPTGGDIFRGMYTMGLQTRIPRFIPLLYAEGPVHSLVFSLAWCVIPFIYCVLFAVLFVASARSCLPSRVIQQMLCIWGVVHFLFLTDMVGYSYGRGMRNPHAEWYHWSEKFVWRIAILLPIYQKVVAGDWKRYYSRWLGLIVHYGLGSWAVCFFVIKVVLFDVSGVWHFATNENRLFPRTTQYIRTQIGIDTNEIYHQALVFMIFVYGLQALLMPCYRITIRAEH